MGVGRLVEEVEDLVFFFSFRIQFLRPVEDQRTMTRMYWWPAD